MKKIVKYFRSLSVRRKIVVAVLSTSGFLFLMNIILFWNINRTIRKVEEVYQTNVNLNQIEVTLEEAQKNMYEYLNTKSSIALENYYMYEQDFRNQLNGLQDIVTNSPMKNAEYQIKQLGESYLEITADTVAEKRGRNISKYKVSYEESEAIYNYIKKSIYYLNNEQFKVNSDNYSLLVSSLRELEVILFALLGAITFINIGLLGAIIQNITKPLIHLSQVADEITSGNFAVKLPQSMKQDEIGIVTRAFNTMMDSINSYILQLQERMVLESQMKEKELVTEGLLKDARLKYYQAQINPHFLFNTLNAGAQLAMMEDAEKTCLFIENMASFFRYNVQMLDKDTTLRDELEVVEHYMYILKTRFADEFVFQKEIQCNRLGEVTMPSMILQPLIENAFNHGIRELGQKGNIHLVVEDCGENILIRVIDNGMGIEQERLDKINAMENLGDSTSDSTGIGLSNVMNRLNLYYSSNMILQMKSAGQNKGTEAFIQIPIGNVIEKEEVYV